MIYARLLKLQLLKLITNLRFIIGIIAVISFVALQVVAYSKGCQDYGIISSPWILPFILETPGALTLGFLIVLFFCDAPFTEANEVFSIMRTNRNKWFISRILYILAVSIIIIIVLFVLSIVFLIPNVGFTTEWGEAIYLSQTTDMVGVHGSTLGYAPQLLSMFTPVDAMLISSTFFVGASFFIGTLMFVVNLFTNRMIGAGVGLFFVLLNSYVKINPLSPLINISPITWSNLTVLDYGGGHFSGPTVAYAVTFLIISSIIMWTLSYLKFKETDINMLSNV